MRSLRVLKPFPNRNGYLLVGLMDGRRKRTLYVHRLILRTFSVAPSENHEVCHNDGVRTNNVLTNLRWGTRTENCSDKLIHGTQPFGIQLPHAKLTEDSVRMIRLSDVSSVALAGQLNVSPSAVYQARARKTWRHVN
jgi:hypothetical protein